jgi:hypothetical protein
MEKISKNCFKGGVITDPNDLCKLALEKKSVYYRNWGVKPAAIYLSMQFTIVIRLIDQRELFNVIKL